MSERSRLDKYLVESGQMNSRSEAQAAIDAGKVMVNGRIATKANQKVSPDDQIVAEKAHPYVSRAALKLISAFDAFDVSAKAKVCLDVGCSTGGFTEVLLKNGASQVYSVDVGTDQFHDRLRSDGRITLFEQTDARQLTRKEIDKDVDLIVCDASFIGLEKVLMPALTFLKPEGDMILLFKPQFQVGRKAVGKGGVVTDKYAIEAARLAFTDWLGQNDFGVRGWAPSPITGSDGNQEYLVWAGRL